MTISYKKIDPDLGAVVIGVEVACISAKAFDAEIRGWNPHSSLAWRRRVAGAGTWAPWMLAPS